MGRVLLTGSRGWIGRLLLDRLRNQGVEVTCLGHEAPGADVAAAAAAADVVVHAGGAYTNRRSEMVEGNIEQTLAVAKGCSKTENTVLYMSSVKMYGWDVEGGLVRGEEDPVTTAGDNYTNAKLLAEQLLSITARKTMVCRIANVYGREMPGKYIVGGMLNTFRRDGKVSVACTGASRRDFVDVDDVVTVLDNMVMRSLKDPGAPGRQVYNIAAGRLITFMQLADLFREILGARVETMNGKVLSSPTYSTRKATEAGFITAFRDPIEGLRGLLEDYKRSPWTPT